MKSYNLQYYVDKLRNGEKFSLARYGDGEMLCMWGKQGGNSNGCRYSPELREALLDSMKHQNDPTFIYGLQRVLPKDEERITKEYPDVDWHDTEIFSEAVANGELYPLIEQLRRMKVLVVGNESIRETTDNIFKWTWFINVPPSNTYDRAEWVIESIQNDTKAPVRPDICIFSCGMAANAIISKLHDRVDCSLIDLGHIWDPFTGNMSRCDLEGKTLEDIEKNLYEKTT